MLGDDSIDVGEGARCPGLPIDVLTGRPDKQLLLAQPLGVGKLLELVIEIFRKPQGHCHDSMVST